MFSLNIILFLFLPIFRAAVFFSVSFFIKCFLTYNFVNPIQCLMFLYVALKRSCLIFMLYRMATRQEPHLEALLRMYQIIAVTYCEPLSSLAAGITRRLPIVTQSGFCWHFSEFTSGFLIFCEKLCLIFLHTALGTHISWGVCNDGISDWGLFVRLNVREGGWFSRLVTSRWMTYLKWCDGGILQPCGVGFLIWATAADLLHTWLD